MRERRVQLGFREDPTDEPGIVLADDGVLYEVAADGTRAPLGSGGSQPDPLRTPVNIKDALDNFVAQFADYGIFFQLPPGQEGNLLLNLVAINGQTGDIVEVDGVDGESLRIDAHAVIHAEPGITGLPDPVGDTDAVPKAWAIPQSGLVADLAAGGHKITGLDDPTASQDAATKAYVDAGVGFLRSVVTDLLPAQCLLLHESAAEIVPAPGAGKANVLVSVAFSSSSGTSYAWGGGIAIQTHNLVAAYGSGTDALAFKSQHAAQFVTDLGVEVNNGDVDDQATVLFALVENPAGGDLTVRVEVVYYVIDLLA